MAKGDGRGGARPGSGRPKGAMSKQQRNMIRMARKYSVDMLKTLHEIGLDSDSDGARVAAANSILDRAFGKPVQMNEHSGPGGGAIQTETKTWRERLREESTQENNEGGEE